MRGVEEAVDSVRSLAQSHLSRFTSRDCIPTDVENILDELGIRLIYADFPDDSFTGCAIVGPDGYSAIIINRLLPAVRTFFTLAHELGHIVLDHHLPRSVIQEHLANVYAGELLMPADRIAAQVRRYGPNLYRLAIMNGVSIPAMRLRLHELAQVVAQIEAEW